MQMLSLLFVLFLLGLPVVAQANALTDHLPFFHQKPSAPSIPEAESQDYQPPPLGAVINECDPIRQQIVALNQQNILLHPFLKPRIGMLKTKHYRCIERLGSQQYQYLHHSTVDPQTAQELLSPLDPSQPTPLPNLHLNKPE